MDPRFRSYRGTCGVQFEFNNSCAPAAGPAGPPGPPGGAVAQTVFVNVATPGNPTNVTNVFADLLTLNITTGANPVILQATEAAELFPTDGISPPVVGAIEFRLMIDGVALPGSLHTAFFSSDTDPYFVPSTGALVIKTPALTAAAHVIKLQWKCPLENLTASIDTTSGNGGEHASLLAIEVTA
jgi:hypothetical protein